MKHIHLKLLFYLCFILMAHSQNKANDYYYKRISIEHGLSNSAVNCIIRDCEGILWVGTRQGLNRIERNYIKNYSYLPNEDTNLLGNNIRQLYEDTQQNLWIVTDGGLVLYNREKDTFEAKLKRHIQSVVATSDGVLFGSYASLFLYDYKTKQITQLPIQKPTNSVSDNDYYFSSLIPLDNTSVLVGTENNGIFIYDLSSHLLNPLITQNIAPLSVLWWDKTQSEIYISVFHKGLYRYNSSGTLIKHYTTENSGLSHNIILDIEFYKGNLWLATDGGGISILNPKNDTFTTLQHIAGTNHSIPANSITVLYQDVNENLWGGTVRDGIFLLKKTHIKTYKNINNLYGLSEKVVISLLENTNGTLWIGTDGGGLNLFDPKTETFKHHSITYGDKIVSITNYSDTKLLVSLYGKGLFLYDIVKQKYEPFTLINAETNTEEGLSGFVPLAYRIDNEKLLILAKNAYWYNSLTHKFDKITFSKGIVPKFALQLVYSDNEKTLLVKENTLYRLKNTQNKIEEILSLQKNSQITSICYEKRTHKWWIASSEGLFFYDIAKQQLEKVTTKLFNQITYMTLDALNQRLWINASNMLFSYHIPNKKFMVWDDSDGFLSNDVLTSYIKPINSPYIYMGGVNGLVKIDKNIIYEDDTTINFALQHIELNGKIYTANYLSQKDNKIDIPHDFNSLKLRVSLNEKDFFRQILFRYHIQSKNSTNFITESYSNVLDINSLAPDQYRIYVSCMSKNGDWSPEFLLTSIKVLPPWYEQWWFILSVIGLILIICSASVWFIMKRNQQRIKWKMAIHQQELNEDKIQFLTNVSHELRTPLTLIYAPLKRLLENQEMDTTVWKKQIENVYRQANHMKSIINWVLDYDKNTSLSESLNKSFVDINDLVRDIVADFEQEFVEKRIQVRLDLQKDLLPIEIDKAKIYVVISNILMNALKFSPSDSVITIRNAVINNYLYMEVEDNGIGFKNVDIDKLFTRFYQGNHSQKGSGIGLAYCKNLIEKHSGLIGAFENEKGGATVYFELPYSNNNDAIIEKFSNQETASNFSTITAPIIDTSIYTVLIVDDNLEFLHYLYDELKLLFKTVLKAQNGKEALHILKSYQPDIIISDVMMPVMNGYQLCKEIKSNLDISHIPVILLTAKTDSDSQKIGYKLGADFYLSKPFDIETLISIVQNQLRHKEFFKQKYQKEILSVSPEIATISNADEQFMLKLNNLIRENYTNPNFGVAEIAKELAMSRASLYNKSKQIIGLGISEYINKYRLAIACSLLLETDKSISEISFETGFTSQRYFSTVFKQAMNKTPSEYRNSH